jgi:hypothetical protein
MRVLGELQHVMDVYCGRYPTGSDAMLAQVHVTLQRLGSNLTPRSVVPTACCCATISISFFADLGVGIAVAAVNEGRTTELATRTLGC